ncbi:hypothetical protein G7085_19125 [Tessaracoccus sp. HDW20]|nr:hypothetical protein [Tessaracoccus coleopterorum]
MSDALARRYTRRGPDNDDLLQVARTGLVLAIHRYRPGKIRRSCGSPSRQSPAKSSGTSGTTAGRCGLLERSRSCGPGRGCPGGTHPGDGAGTARCRRGPQDRYRRDVCAQLHRGGSRVPGRFARRAGFQRRPVPG